MRSYVIKEIVYYSVDAENEKEALELHREGESTEFDSGGTEVIDEGEANG